jgi:8-oxo-dGTP diphosphatase
VVEIKFTICFCLCEDQVLMLHRRKQPNQGRWNGVGGKLSPGETPRAGVGREVFEETGIDLEAAESLTYAGIVTWPADPVRGNQIGGMHAFIARFADAGVRWCGVRPTPDGDLAWHPIAWACDRANPEVVVNIPSFLPHMLASSEPLHYRCVYRDDEFADVEIEPLNTALHE